jgi:molecular chaperone DnaJ
LGLSPGATERELKLAWRRLISQWHPDRNDSANAVARMQRINRAAEAIREAGFPGPAPSTAAPAPPAGHGAEADEPGRDGAEAARPGRRADDEQAAQGGAGEASARTIRRKVRLTLAEAAFGCTRVLRGRLQQPCAVCAGAGCRVLGGHCPDCQGSGAIRQRSWFGWIGAAVECGACHGGGIARESCAACAGSGRGEGARYQVTVRFPHGVRHGDQLHVAAGQPRRGRLPGDLSIRVDVREDPLLKLEPDGTLRCDVPVDGFAWIANRTIDLPTLEGLQKLALQRDRVDYRLPGRGFPVERRGPRGDLVVTVTPIFPQHMTTDQQILLDQLIACTSGAHARQPDERLRAWDQALSRWRPGGAGPGR